MKFFVFILFLTTQVFASNITLKYEPEIVELQGTLELRTYPGPPNYENVRLGDAPEQCYYLRLIQPIDVKPVPNLESLINDVIETNVNLIQLSIHKDSLFLRLRKIGMKKQIKLKGQLFHRHTGHHHTEVLMTVDDVIN